MTPTILPSATPHTAPNVHPAGGSPRRRRRWTREQKRELLARFAASGATATEFCREAGLSAPTFSSWRRRYGDDPADSAPARFARVSLAAATPAPSAAAMVVVELAGGISVSIPVGTDPAWLGQLLQGLRTP